MPPGTRQGALTIGLLLAALLAALAACSPPKHETIALCQSKAILEGRDHSLDASDIGELTEACMLTKGYALKEDGPLCSDDAATAVNPKCYYRNTIMGRLVARFSAD
jgi:hypothetical protein